LSFLPLYAIIVAESMSFSAFACFKPLLAYIFRKGASAAMLASQYYVYSCVSALCLAMFISCYFSIRTYAPRTLSIKYLLRAIVALSLSSVFNVVYGLREAGLFGYSDTLGYLTEIPYTITLVLECYFWYVSSELLQHSPMTATRKRRLLMGLPLLLACVYAALTPLHHKLFYFDDGQYVRAPLSIYMTLVVFVYIWGTGVMALVNSFRKQLYMERRYLRIVWLYSLILTAFSIIYIQSNLPLPFRTIGAAIVIYIVQLREIKENIYVDKLTGANNRTAVDRYLARQLENSQSYLRLAMIDIDNFKEINDTMGHNIGDKALILVARAFMSSLTSGFFFARYGGDEFVIMSSMDKDEELERILRTARTRLHNLCKEADLPNIDFSYGIAQKPPKCKPSPTY